MKYKKSLIAFCTLFTIAVFLSIFLMTWFWGDKYADFKSTTFREEVAIPGLKDGACPQGLAIATTNRYFKDEEGNLTLVGDDEYYFVSAYFGKDLSGKQKTSRIYVTGKKSGYLGYVSIYYNGQPFYGHVGGVATNGTWLWLGSESKVFCAKRHDTKEYKSVADELVKKSLSNGTFEFDTYFEINGSASFINYFKPEAGGGDGNLYVGEFYRAGNYETPKSHHLKTPDGGINRAFMYEYRVSNTTTNSYGLTTLSDDDMEVTSDTPQNGSNEIPKVQKIYSIPDRIQGVARVPSSNTELGDTLILSQSYGLVNSNILMYNCKPLEGSTNSDRISYKTLDEKGFEYAGTKLANVKDKVIPYRDNSSTLYVHYVYGSYNSKTEDKQGNKIYPSFYRSYSIPSMSEGLAISDNGRVNILFESAANKYKLFVRQPLDKIYSFMPTKR